MVANALGFLARERAVTPVQKVGIGGFTAMAIVRSGVTKRADVPSTVVEDGSVRNDHINKRPNTLKIEGLVGDVVFEGSVSEFESQFVDDGVGVITQFEPLRTAFQQTKIGQFVNRASNEIDRINRIIEQSSQPISILGNQAIASKKPQELFIDAMDALFDSQQIFSVETSYKIHENMVITSWDYEENNEDSMIRYSIELSEFRLAELTVVQGRAVAVNRRSAGGGTVGGGARNPSSSTSAQTKSRVDKGVQAGKKPTAEKEKSVAKSLFGGDDD